MRKVNACPAAVAEPARTNAPKRSEVVRRAGIRMAG
jgi:hypothetical protein